MSVCVILAADEFKSIIIGGMHADYAPIFKRPALQLQKLETFFLHRSYIAAVLGLVRTGLQQDPDAAFF